MIFIFGFEYQLMESLEKSLQSMIPYIQVDEVVALTKATAAFEQQQCFRRLFCAIATNKVSNIKHTSQHCSIHED